MPSLAVLAVLATLVLSATAPQLSGQTAADNAVYAELLGSGGLYSLNYERRVSAARVRVGYASWTAEDLFGLGKDVYHVIPITVSHVAGSGTHHLESGAGVALARWTFTSVFDAERTSSATVTLTGIVGYRYQKPGSGFLFRAVITPMYGLGSEGAAYPAHGFFPSFGLSFGAAF